MMKKPCNLFLATVTMLMLALSCNKAMEVDTGVPVLADNTVSFAPSLKQFGGDTPSKALGVRRMSGGPMPLYLHSFESDYNGDSSLGETKTAPVTEVYSSFKASGYAFLGSWSEQNKPNLFFGETVNKVSSSWSTEARMVWPGADFTTRFYAVSPATASGLSWTSTSTSPGAPVINYTVQNAVGSQLDLIESVSSDYPGDGSTASSGVALTFSHALTAIKFITSDFGVACTVKTITISDVYNSGSHAVGSGEWFGQSGSGTYTLSPAAAVTVEGDVTVTSGASTLLLMPQTCPAGAKITVTLTKNATDYDIECDLEGMVWAPGKEITYTISLSDDDWLFGMVDISSVPASVTSGVATNVAVVKSFRQHAFGKRAALPWTVEYSTDGGASYSGTKPSWLTSITPTSGSGGWSGETISATATRTSNAEHRVKVKVSNDYDSKTFDVVIPEVGPFGGLHIAPAPLYYNGTTFEIKDNDWNHDSYNSVYGKNNGSYYFNFIQLGQYFDADGGSFSTSSVSIDNANKISYDGHDWRLPTWAEWCTITTAWAPGTSRTGSTVNGSAGGKYAIIQLTGVAHAGSSTPVGLLLFPDGCTVSGKALSGINNNTCTTGVTASELQAYLDQGCVFLPASGRYYDSSWSNAGYLGGWWSATEYTASDGYFLTFNPTYVSPSSYNSKSSTYYPVRLVR